MAALLVQQDRSRPLRLVKIVLLAVVAGTLMLLGTGPSTAASPAAASQAAPHAVALSGNAEAQAADDATGIRSRSLASAKSKKFSRVAVGGGHTCALEKSGQVRCWGSNKWLQTGDPKAGFITSKPVKVAGLPKLKSMSAGFRHNCGLTKDGRVFCWGENSSDELGVGAGSSAGCPVDTGCPKTSAKAVAVKLTGPTAVAAGTSFSCAISRGQQVLCWGLNEMGQLGNGTTTSRPSPAATPITGGASQLALGDEHACALLPKGEVRCWGANYYGQLGSGVKSFRSLEPVAVTLPAAASSITAGLRHTCAQLANGEVFCWGDNRVGQLGDGTKTARPAPTKISVSGVRALAAGGRNTCVINTSKKLKCWGDNGVGQLGLGNTKKKSGKKTVKKLASVSHTSINYAHVCAVSKGAVKCWGNNSHRQLGDRTKTNRYTPVKVK